MEEKYGELINLARKQTRRAHPKLSGYRVGAAVLGVNGRVCGGYNVETDIHHAIHAEMSAIHALMADSTTIQAIAVACTDRPWFPCGWCRQWIWEYAESPDAVVIACCTETDQVEIATISELLPDAFKLEV